MNTAANKHRLLVLAALGLAVLLLNGCGAGSGASVQEIVSSAPQDVSNYSGPPPASEDVQNFKLALWDNLVPENRCGSCHNESQNPRFVRADDINLAFQEANALVDLSDPAQSQMVSKVRGGHNCWLTSDDACADTIVSYIQNWAGNSLGGGGNTVTLTAPPIFDPGASRNFPAAAGGFAGTVYPLLNAYCADCHSDAAASPQQPFFASPDIDTAYDAAKTKIDLDTPASSRFVLRLGSEFHNCWSNCSQNANEMENAIASFANGIPLTEVSGDLVTSKALTLPDGIIAASGGRVENNVIALYEFKTGSGSVAFDTSGVEPALNLTLSGDADWVGGWGISMAAGKAQGSTSASRKLADRIAATNEFSIETWVVPGNVTQDGPARIVTYAGGNDDRNFMLGQTLYDYDSFVRTDVTGAAGEPRLSTPSDEEVLQATLQHVVYTYDPTNGRQLYVNGEMRTLADDTPPGLLGDWNDTYALAVGSGVDNMNRWSGTVRLLAVHSRALNQEQVLTNYDAGVGEKYFLLFNVSDHVAIDNAYVVFEVSQFDSYAYLFNAPFFTVLGSDTPQSIPLAGLRIGINGRESAAGQAYANLSMSIDTAAYEAANGQLPLSSLGTIIGLEHGPAQDEFFLTFEQLGSSSNVYVEATPPPPADPIEVPRDPAIGVRDFAEVNASLADITGVATSQTDVANTYAQVVQALPVSTSVTGFISSQQMAVTQLAIAYCSALVDDTGLRGSFFPGVNFAADPATAFSDPAPVIDPLLARGIGTVGTQPDQAVVRTELESLIGTLSNCGGSCPADRTENIVKAACAAVLGSAAMLVQ